MASKIPEEPPNTESGETMAVRMKKKRSRRVSFADTEITSVHIFNRDEDYDTPPNSKPSSRNDNGDLDPDNMVIGFFKDLGGDSEDSGDDEGIVDARKSFLRPIGSPSPGSSTAGSVTSNDGKFITFVTVNRFFGIAFYAKGKENTGKSCYLCEWFLWFLFLCFKL